MRLSRIVTDSPVIVFDQFETVFDKFENKDVESEEELAVPKIIEQVEDITIDDMDYPILTNQDEEKKEIMEEKKEVVEDLIHEGIKCDVCGTLPIVGTRYKCVICNDFDLCGKCESQDSHPSGHPLLKIKVQKEQVHMDGVWRRSNSNTEVGSVVPDRCQFKLSKSNQKLFAKFISSSTVSDRCYLAPGSTKVKTWILQNSGPTEWPVGVHVGFLSGEKNVVTEESLNKPLASVLPGEQIEVSVDVIVPLQPGRYISYFRLVNLEGNKFGPRFWVDFFVPEKEPEAVFQGQPVNIQLAKSIQKFSVQLTELEAVGFCEDPSLNVFLLDKFNGDTALVVNWYLDHK